MFSQIFILEFIIRAFEVGTSEVRNDILSGIYSQN